MDKDNGSTVGADVDQLGVIVERLGQAGLALQDLHVFGNIRRRDLVRVVARVEFLDQREAAQLASPRAPAAATITKPTMAIRIFRLIRMLPSAHSTVEQNPGLPTNAVLPIQPPCSPKLGNPLSTAALRPTMG
jgi:hypothetical protein